MSARAALERRTVQVVDIQADPEYSYFRFDVDPIRTTLAVPMLKADKLVGVITIWRIEVKPFTEAQIELLETFADQAVIAIENVRLFQELEARNRELTEALEQQTATAEILRVISSSPTDLQPVMDAVAENAARVCGATDSSIFRLEGELLRLVARHGSLRRITAGRRHRSASVATPWLDGQWCDGRTIHVEDIRAAEAEFPVTRGPRAGSPGQPSGRCWRRRCCARAPHWASSSSRAEPRSIPSRPSRSRCWRRSPTRR